jgi:hypothetical protein
MPEGTNGHAASQSELKNSDTLRLPCDWQSGFGNFCAMKRTPVRRIVFFWNERCNVSAHAHRSGFARSTQSWHLQTKTLRGAFW